MATGEPILQKLERIVWLDGHESWGQTSRLPLRDDEGKIFGTFGITEDVTEHQRMTEDLERTRRDLVNTSRRAGMAEVATGVLHNVGNVLTSLNVSANVIGIGLRYSKGESLGKVADLLRDHARSPEVVRHDPKSHRVIEYVETLAQHMVEERERLLNELIGLQQNIDHIKEIVTMQQAYATTMGVVEPLDPAALVEDSLRMNAGALIRHSVAVVREFHPVPRIRGEKGKVLQILVNLIRNAKYAVDDGGSAEKTITIRIIPGAPGRVQIVVQDNGIGIPPENMELIFQHGFTTRTKGHGFGLHSARQAATELRGTLTASSDGIGTGAAFTLDLPVADDASDGEQPEDLAGS